MIEPTSHRELKALMHCAKAQAAHALIKELTGPNAAARVAACVYRKPYLS
jgi:hypothetical protein